MIRYCSGSKPRYREVEEAREDLALRQVTL